ncbi:hypothetical protein RSal33209_3227 [Renibacterium salmoninarum ATCC 33209]|uniref:Uncharacterized protein n=1 Tax=Renibacterium salmoninarum (strain ATCC 33209 / DSM 20767 / JCM 11484 / NBRC 15589 / NCIMB 2235) TaxID=288705 RepID=A9WUS3_RENSM|nr:hypothetical protein [Renibacterium salmoninarum]ABY24944.1 hypothetical protein RSal33209_3227 [Renibacterium salmoninarum ATCC 33209]
MTTERSSTRAPHLTLSWTINAVGDAVDEANDLRFTEEEELIRNQAQAGAAESAPEK